MALSRFPKTNFHKVIMLVREKERQKMRERECVFVCVSMIEGGRATKREVGGRGRGEKVNVNHREASKVQVDEPIETLAIPVIEPNPQKRDSHPTVYLVFCFHLFHPTLPKRVKPE